MEQVARRGFAAAALALLCSACAGWMEPQPNLFTQPPAASRRVADNPPAFPQARIAPAPVIVSNDPEDFVCTDGSAIQIRYIDNRDSIRVSLNGATPIALQRADEAGLTAYRSERVVLRRSGPRIALSGDAAVVTVQEGDTLGRIALRAYGDRTRAGEIARANGIPNPDLIFTGQVLQLPTVERRCRRTQLLSSADEDRSLQRRAFSPPSSRQPELRRVRATATDPPLP